MYDKKWIFVDWLAEKYFEKFSDDPSWRIYSFTREVLRKTGVNISPWQFYRIRKKAVNTIHGTVEEQYTKF